MSPTSEDLSAYLDGELTETETRALEKELSKNPVLMTELTELRDAQDFIRAHGPTHAPPDFYNNVLTALEQESVEQSWWAWLARPFGIPIQGVAIAAIAALVLILTIPFNASNLLAPMAGQKTGMRAKSMDLSSLASYEDENTPPQKRAQMSNPDESEEGVEPAAATPADASEPIEQRKKVLPRKGSKKGSKSKPLLSQLSESEAAGSAESPEGALGGTANVNKAPAKYTKEKTVAAQSNGYQYIIETTDVNAAYTLYALVQRHKGSVSDQSGRSAKPNTLNKGDTSVFQVYLAEDAINAFDRQLGSLGSVKRKIPKSMDLTSGGNRRLQVVIRIINDTNAFSDAIEFDSNIPNRKSPTKGSDEPKE